MCVCPCGSLRSTLGSVLQELATLIFETGFLSGSWGPQFQLGWLASDVVPRGLPVPSPQYCDYKCTHATMTAPMANFLSRFLGLNSTSCACVVRTVD